MNTSQKLLKKRIILHSLSIYDITDVSNKVKKEFCNILRVDFIFFTLHKVKNGDELIHSYLLLSDHFFRYLLTFFFFETLVQNL